MHFPFPLKIASPRFSDALALAGMSFPKHRVLEREESPASLETRHSVHLASTIQDIHTLLGCDHWITIKVRPTLFELGEVFHRLECALRSKQSLNIDSAK